VESVSSVDENARSSSSSSSSEELYAPSKVLDRRRLKDRLLFSGDGVTLDLYTVVEPQVTPPDGAEVEMSASVENFSLGGDEAVREKVWFDDPKAADILDADRFELRCDKSGDVDRLAEKLGLREDIFPCAGGVLPVEYEVTGSLGAASLDHGPFDDPAEPYIPRRLLK